jgi:hypothetical protein
VVTMLSNTALKILQTLVHKGVFQDVYEGASVIISLLPYPSILHRYLESIQSLDPIVAPNVTSLTRQHDPKSIVEETQLLASKRQDFPSQNKSNSPSDYAREAILNLDI